MKAKIILLLLLAVFVLCSSVNAVLNDNIAYYYKMEGTAEATDEVGNATLDEKGTVTNDAAGFINTARNGFSAANYFNNSRDVHLNQSNDITVSVWVKFNGGTGNTQTFVGTSGNNMRFRTDASGFQFFYVPGAAACNLANLTTSFATGAWYHLVGVYNGSCILYVNASQKGSEVKARGSVPVTELNIGAMYDGGQPAENWTIDEVALWQRALSPTEVQELFTNQTAGRQYPFTDTTLLTLTLTDSYNGTGINSFAVNITWANTTQATYSTTNGSVILVDVSNSNTTLNVTFWNATNYFETILTNQTVTANSSNTIAATTYQSILNLFSTEKVSNSTVTGATYYIGANSTSQRFNITAATHTVVFTKAGYYNKTDSVTTTAVATTNHTITDVFSSKVNISVYYSNGTKLSNWQINLTSINYTNWTGEAGSTTNGSYYFNGINGVYLATVNSTLGNESFYFTITGTAHNVSYYYFTLTNCTPMSSVVLNFTVRNEETDALLNDSDFNAWFNITSSLFTGERYFNITYSTGNYYLICIPNGTINTFTAYAQIKYSNLDTYAEKNYYLYNYNLTNSSTDDIDLFLTNGTTQTKLQVRDYADDGISEVYIKVLSYDLGTNSYKTTEIVKTDSEGDAYAQIVQNTFWYAFILEKDGEIILQTLPTKITTSPRTFRITSGSDYFDSYDVIQGITYSLSYNNATTTFSLTYSDPTGGVNQGCIKLTKRSINGDTLLNTSCEVSTAATILMNISESPGTNTYVADAYVIIGSENFFLNSTSVAFSTAYKKFGGNGLLLSMLVILVLIMVGVWHPVIAIVMMLVGAVVTNVMGLFYMNWTYLITFIILGILTIYRVGKSD